MYMQGRFGDDKNACNTKNRGRPCQNVKRSVLISLRLTWAEYEALQKLAGGRGKVSTYIRRALFKHKVKSLNMEAERRRETVEADS
jgi:hypothetical protein